MRTSWFRVGLHRRAVLTQSEVSAASLPSRRENCGAPSAHDAPERGRDRSLLGPFRYIRCERTPSRKAALASLRSIRLQFALAPSRRSESARRRDFSLTQHRRGAGSV